MTPDHPPEHNARDEFVEALNDFWRASTSGDYDEGLANEVLLLYDEADTAVKHRDVAEKEAERWFQIADSTMQILTAIHALLHPPLVTTPDGQTFAFKSPVLDEQVQALSDRIRAIPGELAAYGAPPKAEPAGWLRACDEAMVVACLGVANADDTYEQARKKLGSLIDWHVAVATDPRVNGGFVLVPVEPTPEMMEAYRMAFVSIDRFDMTRVWAAMLAAAAPARQVASFTVLANTLKVGDVINITPPPMGEPK